MKDHLIRNIEIRDFKCFDDFKAKGFARVNLIGGKNNVGKTAFMEACYINSASLSLKNFVAVLNGIKFGRENLNLFLTNLPNNTQKFIEQCNKIFVRSNINNTSFSVKEEKEGVREYWFNFNNKPTLKVNINEFSFDMKRPEKSEFIDNFGFSNLDIKILYSSVQKKDNEDYIDQILNDFDSNIVAFKIIDEVPQCKTGGKYLPITELGDGVRHLVSMVTALYATENGYLFIDEIDNGIHYTMMDNIWETILKLSEELNVQVFATTHSKECIESYSRTAQKLKDEDITYTILTRLEDGSIDAGVYDSEMLTNTLEQDHEVRGW